MRPRRPWRRRAERSQVVSPTYATSRTASAATSAAVIRRPFRGPRGRSPGQDRGQQAAARQTDGADEVRASANRRVAGAPLRQASLGFLARRHAAALEVPGLGTYVYASAWEGSFWLSPRTPFARSALRHARAWVWRWFDSARYRHHLAMPRGRRTEKAMESELNARRVAPRFQPAFTSIGRRLAGAVTPPGAPHSPGHRPGP